MDLNFSKKTRKIVASAANGQNSEEDCHSKQ